MKKNGTQKKNTQLKIKWFVFATRDYTMKKKKKRTHKIREKYKNKNKKRKKNGKQSKNYFPLERHSNHKNHFFHRRQKRKIKKNIVMLMIIKSNYIFDFECLIPCLCFSKFFFSISFYVSSSFQFVCTI